MSELKIEWVKLSELQVEPKNPKKHDVEKIMLSIERFGFINPFIKNYHTGKLLAGHGRKKALELMQQKELTMPEQLKEDEGDWLVPVVSGVNIESEEDAMAYIIADNRLEELGGWNTPELLEAISNISDSTPDLSDIGFDNETIELMLQEDEEPFKPDTIDEPSIKEDNLYFDIMFEEEYQQEIFFKFLEHLKNSMPGDTISERLNNHIKMMIEE
jgi:predicted small metal-binding protein